MGTAREYLRTAAAAKNTISSRDCAHFSRLFVPLRKHFCRKPGNRRCLLDDSSFVSFFLSLEHVAAQRAYYLYTCVLEQGFSIIYSSCAPPRVNLILSLRCVIHIPPPPVWTDRQNHKEQSRRELSEMGRADLGANITVLHFVYKYSCSVKNSSREDFVPQGRGLKKPSDAVRYGALETLRTHYLAQSTLELLAISSVNWQIKSGSDNCHEYALKSRRELLMIVFVNFWWAPLGSSGADCRGYWHLKGAIYKIWSNMRNVFQCIWYCISNMGVNLIELRGRTRRLPLSQVRAVKLPPMYELSLQMQRSATLIFFETDASQSMRGSQLWQSSNQSNWMTLRLMREALQPLLRETTSNVYILLQPHN